MSRRRLFYERRHGPRKTGEKRIEWAERIHAAHKLAHDIHGQVCSQPMNPKKVKRLAGTW